MLLRPCKLGGLQVTSVMVKMIGACMVLFENRVMFCQGALMRGLYRDMEKTGKITI